MTDDPQPPPQQSLMDNEEFLRELETLDSTGVPPRARQWETGAEFDAIDDGLGSAQAGEASVHPNAAASRADSAVPQAMATPAAPRGPNTAAARTATPNAAPPGADARPAASTARQASIATMPALYGSEHTESGRRAEYLGDATIREEVSSGVSRSAVIAAALGGFVLGALAAALVLQNRVAQLLGR